MISIVNTVSTSVGACDGCDAYCTKTGITPHRITVVTVNASSIRLCGNCWGPFVDKVSKNVFTKDGYAGKVKR